VFTAMGVGERSHASRVSSSEPSSANERG
jgi:hypothetical protein